MIARLGPGLTLGSGWLRVAGPLSCLLFTVILTGCGGDQSRVAAPAPPKRKLPPLGEYMMPLHDGRIQLAPPEGWEIGSRRTGYVVWFKKSSKSSYPCVLVSAEDFDGTSTVTGSNAKKFAGEICDRLEGEGKSAKGVLPVAVDSFHGVSYRRVGKTKKKFKVLVLDRLIVQTAVDGQLYTFELRAPRDEFEGVKDAVFAVAAGAKFPKSKSKAAPSDENGPGKKPAADDGVKEKPKPATEKPATEKPATEQPATKKPATKKPDAPKKKPKKEKKPDDESEFELLDEEL